MSRARKNLAEYSKKRDFSKTTEPPPSGRRRARQAAKPTFMVHKHDASRLHYDVRLEMDGALASWAVPKGPSFDPSVKRLAVQTEDHPIEYGEFEGRIPDDEYGGGDSLIWDKGTYDTEPPGQASEQRKKGHLAVVFDGEKLKGKFHLVRTRAAQGGKTQWLFFKGKDEYANSAYDVVNSRPESVVSGRVVTRGPERAKVRHAVHPPPEKLLERCFPPMLATLVDAAPAAKDDYVYELKYDGFRAICALSGGKLAMWSRNALDLSARFPEVADALREIVVAEAVIDGEIVAFDDRGAPRFQLLQSGRGEVLCAFDLLWLDGRDLRGRPIEERRDLLISVLSNAPEAVRVAERVEGDPRENVKLAGERGYEGLIAKQRGSLYEAGRSRAWLKLKALSESELAIVGFTPNKSFKGQIGALLLGYARDGALHFAGKVGTGFTAKQRKELDKTLRAKAVADPKVVGAPRYRDAIWVEPELVAQLRYTEWTDDDKLRHPAFLGLRDDKTPYECVRERPAPPPKSPRSPSKNASTPRPSHDAAAALASRASVTITHPEKVLYPRDGITKRDLSEYYEAVSAPLLRALAGRPLALEHYRSGVDGPSEFHQNIVRGRRPWMTIVETPARTKGGTVAHLVADKRETLQYLAQNNTLTVHMWSSRAGSLEAPDYCVFDLDPAEGRGIEQTIPVAKALYRLLEELALPSLVKTSGKRGLHVVVPLAPVHTHEQVVEFAVALGSALAKGLPDVTLERPLAKRRGRLYLDCHQNGYGKTIVAPYSPRAIDGAPVSAPLAWDEVDAKLDPRRFNVRTMPKRIADVGDLFEGLSKGRAKLPRLS